MFTPITRPHRPGVDVGEQLVPGDARVVHQDVEAAARLPGVVEDALPRVFPADVELQGGTPHLVRDLREVVPGGRDVDEDDRGAVAVQGAGDRGADPAGGAGHDRDLPGQGLLGVGGQLAGAGGDGQELAVDKSRAAREEEPERPKGAGARGPAPSASRTPLPVAPARSSFGERAQEAIHALPGRRRGRVRGRRRRGKR